ELFQVAVRLQERILHHILRVLAVLRDVLRDAEDVPVVPPDQILERRIVAVLGRLDERQFFANSLAYVGLDGAPSVSDAVFSGIRDGTEVLFYLVTIVSDESFSDFLWKCFTLDFEGKGQHQGTRPKVTKGSGAQVPYNQELAGLSRVSEVRR